MADKATIVIQSGDMDKLYSAFIIANGALAMGMEVSLFFTFWGLQRLKKGGLEKGPLSTQLPILYIKSRWNQKSRSQLKHYSL